MNNADKDKKFGIHRHYLKHYNLMKIFASPFDENYQDLIYLY